MNDLEKNDENRNKSTPLNNACILLLFIIPLTLYFWFGLRHLTQFETADEYRWITADGRIPQYWAAFLDGDWKSTIVNDKPGITTALVSGFGWKYLFPVNLSSRFIAECRNSAVFSPQNVQDIAFSFRFPLLFVNGLLAVLWYFILRRLMNNNWIALFSCVLILLSPILIGISQMVNPDAMLWSTSFTAIIAFLSFLKERKWYDVLIAGIFMGFALLSKYTTIIIIPYWFGLIFSYLIFNYDNFVQEKLLTKRVLQFLLGYIATIVLAVSIYAYFLPAVRLLSWKEITRLNDAFHEIYPYLRMIAQMVGAVLLDAIILKSWILKKIFWPFKYLWDIALRSLTGATLLGVVFVLANWMRNNFWNIPNIPYDAGNNKSFRALDLLQQIFLELKPLVFSLTPIVLTLLVVTLLVYTFKKKTEHSFVVFAFISLLFIFYAAVLKEEYLVHIRYSLMLYPLVMALASIGIIEIIPVFRWRWLANSILFGGVIWSSILSVQKIYPFYFNYTNDFLPKNDTITTAWGYGGYEAAQYIHSQSKNPESLIVWTDYDGFCPFFSGQCIKDSDIKWVGYITTNSISYYVVTPRGSSKLSSTWEKMKPNIDVNQPVWRIDIDGRPNNFIEVFKVKNSEFANDEWWRKDPK